MYCIKCGVELADSEKVCPLCGTPVFHPDLPCGQGEPPYPPDHRPRVDEVSRAGVLFVLTVLFLLTVGAVYLLTPHTVRKDYTVEAPVPVEAPAEERVDINTADADQLDALPGIGPVLAQRIVDYRETNGPFAAPEELLGVEGIGQATLDGLRSRITVKETQE